MSYKLSEVALMQVKQEQAADNTATFVVEPLSPGFGLTIGNAMRRVLLSSLEGAAITSIRIEGVSHEFSTIKGIKQDVVDIILNLKQVRVKLQGDESQVIVLESKGGKKVKAGDFKCPTGVEILNKDLEIAEVTGSGKLLLEATIERGRGYVPTELRKEEKLPIGVISIDAAFSPVRKVNFTTENTCVGKMTNFDKLILEIETDGSITPQQAMEQSSGIIVDHFSVIAGNQSAVVEQVNADDTTVESIEQKPKKAPTQGREAKAKKSVKTETKKSAK
ncbi:MAG: DNA-directed RNA polymerase subunit alpha [Patescibacteria group bacterium]